MDEQNTSMEELKVDEEENVKDISMEEDILGAQSLLMSEESDDEDTNKSPIKKVSPKATCKGQGDLSTEIEVERNDLPTSPTTALSSKAKRILDSDSETEPRDKNKDGKEGISESKEGQNNYSPRRQKISTLVDSESENDGELVSDPGKRRNRLKLIDSDTENEEAEIEEDTTNVESTAKLIKQPKKSKKPKNKKDVSRTSFSDMKKKQPKGSEVQDLNIGEKKKPKSYVSDLVDSESDDESSKYSDSDVEAKLDASPRAPNNEENNNEDGMELHRKEKSKSKVMRASAKKALDEMQAIQSEQQRLHREASISIPYHKPKKHTLQDFLNRRTIIKPQSEISSPLSEALRNKSLRMNQEELEEYAKLMEERAKEATEFFKSESDDEEGEEFKDNTGVLDMESRLKTDAEESEKMRIEIEDTPKDTPIGVEIPTHSEENCNENGVQLTEEELAEILAQEQQDVGPDEVPSCSKVLITEVIELPKLDMNTVKISPTKKAPLTTPRPSLNLKELLAKKNLKDSPSLSGDPNKLIDLDTGNLVERKPTGVENLMQRLMSTIKARKSKSNDTCNILSTENGKLEITKVNVSITEDKDPNKEPKPGAAYFELKKNLKEIIKKKRLEDLHKKQEGEVEYNKCLDGEEDEEYDEDEEGEEDETLNQVEYEPESKPNKVDIIEIDDEENALVVEDDEEDEEEVEEDEDEPEDEEKDLIENEADDDVGQQIQEDSDDSNDTNEPIDRTKRNRIIKAFDDSDEENNKDDIDFLKTQPPITQPNDFETQSSIKTAEDEENELMALCSGTFDATQKGSVSSNALMSQIPLTGNQGKPVDDNELLELCSGTFEESVDTYSLPTQSKEKAVEVLQRKCNKILSSDEEESENITDCNEKRTKKLTKKLKKKTAKLSFSDDEEEENEMEKVSESIEIEDDEDDHVLPEEEPATFIDYDSEENEIVVQMTKKDCVDQAKNFFENEAELSESEWGSADEDEKNLDKYDVELGDEDEFDKEKIRSELEQIHARKMLDEDMREVRKIQELLFEDEEKDGVGRQRQFKWKNAESGFSLDDGPREDNGEGNNADSGDELNEHQWRKIRFEREQFLKEQGLKPGSQDMSTTLPNTTMINNTMIATATTKKLQIITAKKTSVSTGDPTKSTPFLISKGITAMNKKSVRGSFLVRDKETLNKLAGLTKSGATSSINASDMGDTAGTVSIKSIKAKNFVFATLTEEEHENMKRKADDLLNSSNENGTNFMKKPKIEPRRDKCFIDQLL